MTSGICPSWSTGGGNNPTRYRLFFGKVCQARSKCCWRTISRRRPTQAKFKKLCFKLYIQRHKQHYKQHNWRAIHLPACAIPRRLVAARNDLHHAASHATRSGTPQPLRPLPQPVSARRRLSNGIVQGAPWAIRTVVEAHQQPLPPRRRLLVARLERNRRPAASLLWDCQTIQPGSKTRRYQLLPTRAT